MSVSWVPFDVTDAADNPFEQFADWFAQAATVMREPEAVTVITATPDGRPSARMVLLRHRDQRSYGWYTNYDSRKGRELDTNPHAALLWYAEALGRQVRVEGLVEKMSAAQSDAYFASRPRAHQIGAQASRQSRALLKREDLVQRVQEIDEKFEGQEIPRPENWGGYELRPDYFEFWQHREDRLHDRVVYTRDDVGGWQRRRLSP